MVVWFCNMNKTKIFLNSFCVDNPTNNLYKFGTHKTRICQWILPQFHEGSISGRPSVVTYISLLSLPD
jgi:hypothetical protein